MSFTFADNKLGGRLTAACDAIGAGHLHKAASIFSEITEELNAEATAAAMNENEGVRNTMEDYMTEIDEAKSVTSSPSPPPHAKPADLQMCARNVHSYGAADPVSGWRTCSVCGNVNVAPPDNQGFVDMGARR